MIGKRMTREEKVNEFRKAAGKKDFDGTADSIDESIATCIVEELNEFFVAAEAYVKDMRNYDLRADLCKEWADLQYVVSQAAVYFNIPAEPSFNRVHNSNLSKVVDGKVIFREDGKIVKGPNYVAPNMRGL